MRYGSICSGIEAASVAFKPLGWEAAWFSEIDKFPSAVLAHHYPEVPNYGDMTTIAERILKGEVEAPDMICGGTPCQAFSVAGLRNSLDDDRGNLTLQFIKICDANDTVRRASGREDTWILYENVPGLLSTHDNAFGSFLGGLVGGDTAIPEPENGWPNSGVANGPRRVAAWRTLNAEYFGLAQRRKRVFVLALGGAGRWAAADALLPIIESSRWHPAPSRGKGEGVTPCPARGAENSGGAGIGRDGDPMFTLDTTGAHAIAHILRGEGFDASEDGTGRVVPLVTAFHENQRAEITENNTAGTLKNGGGKPGQGYPAILVRMREGKEGGGKGPLVSNDQSLTLATANDQVLAVQGTLMGRGENSGPAGLGVSEGPSYTLTKTDTHGVMHGMQVRRLTPVECEKLQGFPPGYTAIPWRGKPAEECPDGSRYKALGNSWAVNVVRWIGERINAVKK